MSCLRSLLSLLLALGGLALFVYGFYGIAQGSEGLGSLVAMGLGVVLILLGVVNSASIVKAQREKEINRVVDRRLQNRR
jgi:peptidoglycan/LPS O-acetylase OafA/YrhL